jgi:hypothetical protein
VLCASALSLPLDPIIPGDKIISFRKIGSGNSRTNKTNKAAGRIALSHVPVQQRLAPVSHSKGMARRKGPRSQAAADAALAPACRPARPRGSAACPCPGPLPGSYAGLPRALSRRRPPLPLPAGVPRRRCRTGGRELVAWCYSREWGVGLPGWTPGLRGGGSRSGGGVRRGVRCGGERESERDQRESVSEPES